MSTAYTDGLQAFKKRDFAAAQEAWAALADDGDDRVLTLMSEYRYANGDYQGSHDLAIRRGFAGEARPSAGVQFARAQMMLNGADDPVVVPVLTKADEDDDADASAWLAEALHEIGDNLSKMLTPPPAIRSSPRDRGQWCLRAALAQGCPTRK